MFKLTLKKNIFMFVLLVSKPNSNISLDLTIKQAKLKYNNVFVNRFTNKHARFN